jgi:hypothetical protein
MNTRHVRRIDELARDVPPTRDLWPGIAQAIEQAIEQTIEATPAAQSQHQSRGKTWWPAPAIAAAMALVALGVVIGRQMTPEVIVTTAATHGTPADDVSAMPAAYQRDAEYRAVRDRLLIDVQQRLESMPAAEREKVAASLATLRRSIGEIEAALGRDPANALLQELLVNSSQEEMRALIAVRDSGSQEI